MKQGILKTAQSNRIYLIAAAFVLTNATTVNAARSAAVLAARSTNSSSITALLGMAMVSIGCIVFLTSMAKHLTKSRRPKKNMAHPVLFDKLDSAAVAKLQHKITQIGHTQETPPHICEPNTTAPDIFSEICESAPHEIEHNEEFVYTTSHTDDDSTQSSY